MLCASPPAYAIDVGDGAFQLNGYTGIAYLRTNGNLYDNATKDGSYDNVDLALVVNSHPMDRVFLGAQFTIAAPQEASVDWAFGEYRVSDEFRVRIGKMKQPVGIYTEIFDVGTLRPFYTLPMAVYGPASIVTEAYYGIGLTGTHAVAPGWDLAWDVYGGNATITAAFPYEALTTPGTPIGEDHENATRELLGGRVTMNTPVDGLNFRLSGFRGARDDATAVVYGFSVEFLRDSLWVRAEGFREMELDTHSSWGAYGEIAYFLTRQIQLAGRLEGNWSHMDGFNGSSPLFLHREAAVGLNFWFNPQWVVKASLHGVDGNRFANPGPDTIADQPMPTQTTVYMVGTQFNF